MPCKYVLRQDYESISICEVIMQSVTINGREREREREAHDEATKDQLGTSPNLTWLAHPAETMVERALSGSSKARITMAVCSPVTSFFVCRM